VRLASAWVSILSVPLMYFVVRAFSDRIGAIVATGCLVLDPLQVGWGRSDVHPHGSTTWIALLLAWALLRLFQSGARRYVWAVVVLMGLSFHQYPSGQFVVLMPFLVLGWSLLRERAAARRVGWWSLMFGVGLALWMVGWPLEYYLALRQWYVPDPFTMFGERTAWASNQDGNLPSVLVGTAAHVIRNARDYLQGLYVQVPRLHHQDFLPELPGVPATTTTWLVAALATTGAFIALVSRRRWTWGVLLAWFVAGLVPMVFSNVAVPKRGSTAYPALIALAGLTTALLLGRLRRTLGRGVLIVAAGIGAVAFVGHAAVASYQWFSGERYAAGRPIALSLAEAMGRQITPGTILIVDGDDSWMTGRLLFLLLPFLLDPARQPSVATHLGLIQRPFEEAAANPPSVITWAGHTYLYHWTDLSRLWPGLEARRDWRRVVFAFQTGSDHDGHGTTVQHLREALARCPEPTRSSFTATDPAYDFQFVACSLGSWKTRPVAAAAARAAGS
jgi:4-amino-4-deoxy-L-arabinose transferase-like glycosyltransferase